MIKPLKVSLSERINETFAYMLQGEYSLALSSICIAVDITAQKHYANTYSSKDSYKLFLKENMSVITIMGMGNIMMPELKIKFVAKDVKQDSEGFCTFEQIVYHVMRCGLLHSTGEDSNIVWDSLISFWIDDSKRLHLSPTFIWGFALAVIICEENKGEKTDDANWISLNSFKYFVNDLWGRKDIVKKMIKSDYGIDI